MHSEVSYLELADSLEQIGRFSWTCRPVRLEEAPICRRWNGKRNRAILHLSLEDLRPRIKHVKAQEVREGGE